MREFTVSRRGVLGGAALLAAPAIIRPARAAEQCVVGTWGGDYARLLRENIDEPILKPAGIEIVQDIGDESPRVSKLYAQSKLPRGSVDIACVGAVNGYRVNDAGLVEDLDETEVPNLKHVVEELRMPGFVPHIYSAQVLVYNPDNVTDPPQNVRRPARSEVAGQDRHGQHRGALGGDGGKPARDRQDHGLRQGQGVHAEAERQRAAAVSGDRRAGAGVQIGRDLGRRDLAGADLHVAERRLPGEGQFPAGRRDPLRLRHGVAEERAEQGRRLQIHQRDAGAAAQQGFAAHMGYLPTVDDAPLSGKVGEQLAFPDPKPKLVTADYPVFAQAMPDLNDWWLKNIQRG